MVLIRRKSGASRLIDLAAGAALGAAVTAVALTSGAADDRSTATPDDTIEGAPGAVRAYALSVIDGDTFEARVQVFPGQEIVTRVRLAGVDAPERRGRCPSEIEAAAQATKALAALVEDRPLTLTAAHGDKYFGRVVARVIGPDDEDVAEALIASGHGRPYSGGKRAGWC